VSAAFRGSCPSVTVVRGGDTGADREGPMRRESLEL